MTRVLTQILDVVLPTSCIFCESLGSHQCSSCTDRYRPNPHWVSRRWLAGFSATELSSGAAALLRAVKDQGRTALISRMAQEICLALEMPAENPTQQRLQDSLRKSQAVLVPVPVSDSAMRSRGFDVAGSIARKIAAQLNLRNHRGLSLVRQPEDQRRLGELARFSNLHEAMRYRCGGVAGREVVLVDDVVTTGATLLEAARAVASAGNVVVGFMAFAQTHREQDAKSEK